MNRFFFSFFVITTAPVSAGEIVFADGFESGNTCAWGSGEFCATFIEQEGSPDPDGNPAVGTYDIHSFMVNSGAVNYFIEKTMCRGNVAHECGWYFTMEREISPGVYTTHTAGTTAVQVQVYGNSPAGDTPTHWRFAPGLPKTSEFNVVFNNAGGTPGMIRLRQTGFSYDTDGNDADGDFAVPLAEFVSDEVDLANQSSLTPEAAVEELIRALPYTVGTPGVLTFVEVRPGILELVVE